MSKPKTIEDALSDLQLDTTAVEFSPDMVQNIVDVRIKALSAITELVEREVINPEKELFFSDKIPSSLEEFMEATVNIRKDQRRDQLKALKRISKTKETQDE